MRRACSTLAAAAVAMMACSGGSDEAGMPTGPAAPRAATPVITPSSGSYTAAQSVTITSGTPGATIHYTVDGSTPTAASPGYVGAIQVLSTTTLMAIATAPGYSASLAATAVLTINTSAGDFATFCAGLQADLAALQVSCTRANPDAIAAEGGVPCSGLTVEVQAGRIVYDPAHADDCRTAVTGAGCAGLDQGGEPAACRLALVGQVGNGSTCYDGAACPGGFCSGTAGACPGLCVPFATLGQTCTQGDQCAAGLVCDFGSSTCQAPSAAGGPCPCLAGLYCDATSMCAARKTSGACATFEECAVGSSCTGSPSPTCQPLVGLGGACSATDFVCGRGYHCGGSDTCVADPKVGDACTPGQSCIGGFCDSTSLRCVATVSGTCSAATSVAALSLYDGFRGATLDGALWQNGGFTRGVSGGAALLGVDVTGMMARSIRNDTYTSQINVVTGGQRVTALQADVAVPAATVARTGSVLIRAAVRQLYSPPLQRLSFPGANRDVLVAEVGLLDDGTGLKAYRQFSHCDDASCATTTTTGIAVTDPAGFAPIGTGLQVGAPAAYDTSYTVRVSLDEATGVFHWSIAGGSFGTPGVSGTANPAAYLAATPGWAGVALAGPGFQVAQLAVRASDLGAGGGAARVSGRFDNVLVGFNDAAATAFDDFSGSGVNSGPAELSLARWTPGGASTLGPSGGSLLVQIATTAPGATSVSSTSSIPLGEPAGLDTLQADVALESFASTAPGGFFAGISGRFYNDGTGTAPDDATGDVYAHVGLQASSGTALYFIGRCTNPTCGAMTVIAPATTIPGPAIGSGGHRLTLRWDAAARRFTFGRDGATVVVNPTAVGGSVTAAAPYGGPVRSPVRTLLANASVAASSQGMATSGTARFSDLFTGP